MNTQPAPVQPWGERTYLLDKRLAYVFSLRIVFIATPGDRQFVGQGRQIALRLPDQSRRAPTAPTQPDAPILGTYHVADEELVTTLDGIVRDVPRARLVRAQDFIDFGPEGVGDAAGRVLAKLEPSGSLSLAYNGVLTLSRGAPLVPNVTAVTSRWQGSAFIAIQCECESAKFRWLVENQLFGFGRFRTVPETTPAMLGIGAAGTADVVVEFDYDVYAAG